MNYYNNKTILITGASSGIGEIFAIELDKLGANLILTARSKDKLELLASKMNNAIVIDGDLSNKEFSNELYNKIKSKNISIDILINNAAFGFSGKFLDSSMKNYEEMINLNMYSLVNLTYLFLKDMVEKKNGGIINISSLASFMPMPLVNVYAATKAFVTSFSVALNEEYKNKGIKILAVCPGYTRTNFNKRANMNSIPAKGLRMEPIDVVKQSLRSFQKGKFLIINGRINVLTKIFTSILPLKLSLKMVKSIIKKGMINNQW